MHGNVHKVRRNQDVSNCENPLLIGSHAIHITRVRGRHEWVVKPVRCPSFNEFLINATDLRPEMQRFYERQCEVGLKDALSCCNKCIYEKNWFTIPTTLPYAISFDGEELKVYYLDRMHKCIRDAATNDWKIDFEIWYIPLTFECDYLLGQWRNKFQLQSNFQRGMIFFALTWPDCAVRFIKYLNESY